jgi:transitional endoplasmic reticulum ATPase
MVDESPSDDNSVAILHPTTMETLGLFRLVLLLGCRTGLLLMLSVEILSSVSHWRVSPRELILVRGKRRKDTVLICLSQDDIEEGKIAMNKGG